MTPAIQTARRAKISFDIHEYKHDVGVTAYGDEVVAKLRQNPAQIFKTLVMRMDTQQLAVAVVPVSCQLATKALAATLKCKKVVMAAQGEVQKATGYVLGGVSPLGQKKKLVTLVDSSAQLFARVYVSGGRRGLEIGLAPDDLLTLTDGCYANIAK